MNSIPIIQCPIDCLASFSEVLEYDWDGLDSFLKQRAIYNPVIVDIGANVGAFTLWAQGRFRNATFRCYEPHPEIFGFLKSNVGWFAQCHNHAVGDFRKVFLKRGRNRLCTSFTSEPECGVSETVSNIPPDGACESANIVKIDCEGAEADILKRLTSVPDYLVLEYHSDSLRIECELALIHKMTLVGSSVLRPGIGILKFAKI